MTTFSHRFLATALITLGMACAMVSAQTMKEWQDPGINAVNRLPMHTTYTVNIPGQAAQVNLDGNWRFHFAQNADERPQNFFRTDFSDRSWATLAVPANWEMNGYGDPQYINNGYGWRNQSEICPPKVPAKGNHVGSYRRMVHVPANWKGKDIIAHFGSMTSCMYLWVNGRFVGYSEDSKLEPEFDLTPFLTPGRDNLIAFQVFRWCDGSYLEDQDFFRYSGVARHCYLQARDKRRINDLRLTPDLDAAYRDGTLSVDISRKGSGKVHLSLADADGREVASAVTTASKAEMKVAGVKKWTAETPYLYTLTATLEGSSETLSVRTGFRKIEISGSQVLVNGQPVLFKGADRHELDPDGGYVLSRERMVQDIRLMKQLNLNAVRTCHYPDDALWYDLCDEYGLYMVAEANIESHGMGYGDKTLARRADYHKAHQERNQRNVERNFNHPAIIFWSLGNESGYGPNFEDAYDLVKSLDSSRPVQYEQAGKHGKTDVYCPMYYGYNHCQKYCEDATLTRPLIQCEYAHAMGNSEGGFKEYWDLVRRYPKYQGGFIWDFVDQSPRKRGTNGKTIYGYGGDWNRYDAGDGNFCDNGLVSPDRVPNPHAFEVQRVLQNIHTTLASVGTDNVAVNVYNENFFTALDDYALQYSLLSDGTPIETGTISQVDVAPQSTARITLPVSTAAANGELLLNVAYAMKRSSALLPAGTVVARDQIALPQRNQKSACVNEEPQQAALAVDTTDYNWLIVAGENFRLELSKHSGFIARYAVNGIEMLKDGTELRPNFWRAPTDNDYGASLQRRYAPWREPEMKLSDLRHEMRNGQLHINATLSLAALHATLRLSYVVSPSGKIDITQHLTTAADKKDQPGMFRFGMIVQLPEEMEQMAYYGRGPMENYADRNRCADLGIYQQTVTEQFYPYIRPQETGTHTDLRWLRLSQSGGRGLQFTAAAPFSASALHYSLASLDNGWHKTNTHSPEVEPISATELCIDLRQIGLGCEDSWGRIARPEYLLPYGDYDFQFTITPIGMSNE